MTVSVEDTKEAFVGTGAQLVFSFDFPIALAEELLVFVLASDGTETPLVLDTDYTVTLNTNQNTNPGGTVTFTLAPDVGVPFVIMRNLNFTRGTEFTTSVPPHIIESELDRLTMYAQQLGEVQDRSLHVSAAQADTPQVYVGNEVTRAAKIVGFDDEGQVALYELDEGSLVGPAGPTLASRVELSDPAVFRQSGDGEWSHTELTANFIWSINGTEVENREVVVEINDVTGLFIDPGLVEPGDDFTSTLLNDVVLRLTSEFDGQREYAEFAIVAMPSNTAYTTDTFGPTWGAGEFSGGDPAGTVTYTNRAGVVTLHVSGARTATSSSNAMTWQAASIPVAIRPAVAKQVQCVIQADNTDVVLGTMTVNANGSATFLLNGEVDGLVVPGGALFQSGEAKGLPARWSVVYPL